MRVPCPRGNECSGATSFVIPECFLSKSDNIAPSFINQKMRQESSGLFGFFGFAALTGLEMAGKVRYDI